MRAHFALEETTTYEPDKLQQSDDDDELIEKQINDFKNDPEKMEIVTDFVGDVLRIAEIEAENKLKLQQETSRKTSGQFPVLGNLKNGRIVNRARGVMVRLFDVICNCANAAAAPAQQLSSKRLSKN